MKVKANNKINRLDSATAPCSRVQFHQLTDGDIVEVSKDVGEYLINNGFVEQVVEKKSKSKEKK